MWEIEVTSPNGAHGRILISSAVVDQARDGKAETIMSYFLPVIEAAVERDATNAQTNII